MFEKIRPEELRPHQEAESPIVVGALGCGKRPHYRFCDVTDPVNHARWEDTLRLGWGAEIREVDANGEPADYTTVFSPDQEAFSFAALVWYYSGAMGLSINKDTAARYKVIRDYIATHCWKTVVDGADSPSSWAAAGVPADYCDLLTLGPWRTRDQMRTASVAYLETRAKCLGKRSGRDEKSSNSSDIDDSDEADELFGRDNRVNVAFEDELTRAHHGRREDEDAAAAMASPDAAAGPAASAESTAAEVVAVGGAGAAASVSAASPAAASGPAASAESPAAGVVAVVGRRSIGQACGGAHRQRAAGQGRGVPGSARRRWTGRGRR